MHKVDFVRLTELSNCAAICGEHDVKWFAQLVLDGTPEGIADFKLEVLFLMRKPDGSVDRMVRLKNIRGEVNHGIAGDSDVLDAVSFSAPEKFRAWCLARGNFNWGGNQIHLQTLHRDVGGLNIGRTVDRIDSCGWVLAHGHHVGEKGYRVLKGIWFFDDCAIVPGGHKVRPDENGIIWHEGKGYFLNHKGREVEFKFRKPKMKPDLTILNCGIDYDGWTDKPKGETEEDHLRAFFRELCRRSYEAIGGYDAWLSLGGFYAFAAAPEIYEIYKIFPGQLVHGQTQSGKNKWVEWQVGTYGMDIVAGLSFQTSTAVGLLMEAENYSNLPVPVDEFGKGEIDPAKLAVLHNAANRQMIAKWVPADGEQRTIKTAYVVSGERTCNDAAFRSRYLHIHASAERRLADHLAWFDENKRFLFLLGRFILEHRAAFVQHALHFVELWLKNPISQNNGRQKINDREKQVVGICYGAWMALCALLQSHGTEEVAAFKQCAVSHLCASSEDVIAETNVTVFWNIFITCWKAGAIPRSCVKVKGEVKEHPPGAPDMGHWVSYVLYLEPHGALSAMQAYLSRQNGSLMLSRNDLRDQMKPLPYFHLTTKDASGVTKYLCVRFGTGKDSSSMRAWGIDLDLHPYGLQRDATRQEYDKFLMDDSLGDPRKGPLFAIVHALLEDNQ